MSNAVETEKKNSQKIVLPPMAEAMFYCET
jgi:hypothetical protein